MRQALEAPLRAIADNAGDEPSVVVAKVVEGKDNFGYNASTGVYGDLVDIGVDALARDGLLNPEPAPYGGRRQVRRPLEIKVHRS